MRQYQVVNGHGMQCGGDVEGRGWRGRRSTKRIKDEEMEEEDEEQMKGSE